MKLVVFAHTPPPFHGQSYMVQLMLDGLGGDHRRVRQDRASPPADGVECYHVNARVSKSLEDVGGARFGKLALLFGYCLQAIWCRFRYSATTLYYVPAPGKKVALYRDWLVMGLCRPFFKRVVLHWHATSLARWLETSTNIRTRGLTYRLMGQADLSIVLSEYNRPFAEKLWPRRIAVVANGIPDPCPQFEERSLPRRKARLAARKKLAAGQEFSAVDQAEAGAEPHVIRVLFLAHCTREKGLFDAVQATLLANEQLRAQHSPLSLRLIVAGTFPDPNEKAEFDRLCTGANSAIQYAGFLQGELKSRAMLDADLLCFPSHWESFGLVLVEAMAFGLPMAATRCSAVPDLMPANYHGLADVGAVEQIAAAMLDLAFYDDFTGLRRHFEAQFTLSSFSTNLAAALRSVEGPSAA